jgi:hypothetical protein
VIAFSNFPLENIMLRTVGAILAASLAAPYVASLLIHVLTALVGASTETSLLLAAPSYFDGFLDLLKFLVIGTFGAMMFGVPIILGASLVACALHVFALHTKRYVIASGSGLGCVSLTLLFVQERSDPWIYPMAGLLSGAICGWVYWRIAIGRTPDGPHAIDPA